MRRAIQLAANGRGFTSPNPMVGAVIVDAGGRVIGEGWHRRCGSAHAEVNAVESVTERSLLSQSTIYVTLEPCSHYGKTPPCADLIVRSGIPRVVVGSLDPNEKVAGKGVARLRDAGVEVVVGVLERECRDLNPIFLTAHIQRRPYVLLKWACSADGYLDRKRSSSEPAERFSTSVTSMIVHQLRSQFDAIMVGSGTVIADNPRLDVRLWHGRSPQKVVIDRRGRLSADSRLFDRADSKPLLFTAGRGVRSAETIVIEPDTSVEKVLDQLYSRGITSVMVEGGATLIHSFIEAGLWDEARIEISSRMLGDEGRRRLAIPQGIVSADKIDGNTVLTVLRAPKP